MKSDALVPAGREPEPNAVVARHNNLIEAQFYASPQEQRLFLWAVHQAQEGGIGSQLVRIAIADLARFIGLEANGNLYGQMIDVTDRIRRRMVTIRNMATGELVQANLMNARYELGSGHVEVELSRFVLPYIIELKKNFTTVDLKYVMALGSGHAMRIYDLLKSRLWRGHLIEVEVDELQTMLGTAGKYPRFNNFRQFVLEVACGEINRCTDLKISYKVEPAKTDKRKAGSIVFTASLKPGQALPAASTGQADRGLVEHLARVGVSTGDAETIVAKWAACDRDRIQWHLAEVERLFEAGQVRSPAAWIKKGIEQDFRPGRSALEREVEQKKKTAAERKARAAHESKVKEDAAAIAAAAREARLKTVVATLSAAERQAWIDEVAAGLKGVVREAWLKRADLLAPMFRGNVIKVAAARTGSDPKSW